MTFDGQGWTPSQVQTEPVPTKKPRRNRKSARAAGSLLSRLYSRVEVTDTGCWEWQGYRMPYGYGMIGDGDGRTVTTHRASYELAHGPIGDGQFICHRCDNPPCINPAHLIAGTPRDNMQDKMRKGRAPRGIKHPNARLSDDDVAEIKRLYKRTTVPGVRGYRSNSAELAVRFGVSKKYIANIASGRERTNG